MTASFSRRGFVRSAAAGAALVGGAGLLASPARAAASTKGYALARSRPVKLLPNAASIPPGANPVSLYCSVLDQTDYDSGGTGSFTLLCGNDSPNATTGPISLKILTPFLTNCSASNITAPSGWTINQLHNDDDSYTPSLFQISNSSPLGAGDTIEVTVALTIDPNTPNRPPGARAIFSTDLANTTDYDTDLIQNWWTPCLARTNLAQTEPGTVNLVFSSDGAVFAPGSAAQEVPFSFYNYAGSLLEGTQSTSYLYFYTPPYVIIPSSGRPAGLSIVYEDNSDPMIPSIYQLAVPPGVGALGATVPTTIDIPFQVLTNNVSGYAPLGPLTALGIYAASGDDSQGDLSTAYHAFAFFTALETAV
jgi:hypothetical protein